MTRWLTGVLLLCASLAAAACPLCLGAFRQSPAQDLAFLIVFQPDEYHLQFPKRRKNDD